MRLLCFLALVVSVAVSEQLDIHLAVGTQTRALAVELAVRAPHNDIDFAHTRWINRARQEMEREAPWKKRKKKEKKEKKTISSGTCRLLTL